MQTLVDFKKNLATAGVAIWLPDTKLETLWHFEMKADRAGIWKHISDTSRFNRELGLPPRVENEKNGELHVSTTTLGFPQEWIEEPWTWVSEQSICSVRRYKQGLAKSVQSVFQISESPDQSKRIVSIYFGWNPRNIFWKKILQSSEAILKSKFQTAFSKIDSLIEKQNKTIESSLLSMQAKDLGADQLRLLTEKKNLLQARNLNQKCIDSLLSFIKDGDDMDLESIRLIPLANQRQLPIEDLLVVALHATRVGLLRLSWNVICPHCRGSRLSAASLGELPGKSDCTVCDIQFSTDTAESIEIVFHIQPSIREIKELVYCAAEPAKKSHIKVQQRLMPGEQKKVAIQLAEGIYRARVQGEQNTFEIEIRKNAATKTLQIEKELPTERVQLSTNFILEFSKSISNPSLFVIEELEWKDLALRPGHVLSLPEFRDLFSEEHLQPNMKLYLGEQSILFTDIVGSTNFYKAVGDARAFAEVQRHFQEVVEEIKASRGVLIKTIGDAAMGAFPRLENALSAAVKIQERFRDSRNDTTIRLRISVHAGPLIGVKLDTGIDYFGSTVNFAAKIQACAGAHEIVLSNYAHQTWQKEFADKFPIETRLHKQDINKPVEVFVATVS